MYLKISSNRIAEAKKIINCFTGSGKFEGGGVSQSRSFKCSLEKISMYDQGDDSALRIISK
jgi:hypothetical protein